MNASVSQNQILSASSGREHRTLGSLLGALLCALGGGYGGDDSLSLGVSAVASEVNDASALTSYHSGNASLAHPSEPLPT